ncbi:MAG: NAD(P)-dependent glycerol-3-phosphate dehydrogenase [Gemmatimonadetes bacterium]|nr:NAD(P)-dependent glycerol-3-phosphate dehydrogenase [Gemmatimonadota bacterium]
MSGQPAAAHFAVIGAGSWGTTLAALLVKRGHRVRLWAREREVAEQIRNQGENRVYLPGIQLPQALAVTGDIAEAVSGAEVVVSVTPSQFVNAVMREATPSLTADALVVSASKGIETSTLRTCSQVLAEILLPEQVQRLVVLSGPSFAVEVAQERPTAVVVASRSPEAARRAQQLLQTNYFRVYTNADVLGVELGGSLKNVIALAAGAAAGLGFGHNTLAALITRGLAEMTRLGVALGAERATFSGLAGLGDLVLTCTGDLSRNRTVGYRLGRGESLDAILRDMTAVAEGIRTAQAVHALAKAHNVETPISDEVYAILTEGRSPRAAVQNLMLREPKPEQWS